MWVNIPPYTWKISVYIAFKNSNSFLIGLRISFPYLEFRLRDILGVIPFNEQT